MDELKELLAKIEAARSSGTDAATLNKAISAATAGRFSSVAALEVAVNFPPVAAQETTNSITDANHSRGAREVYRPANPLSKARSDPKR